MSTMKVFSILTLFIVIVAGMFLVVSKTFTNDFIKNPPLSEEFYSPNLEYVFLVSSTDNWKSHRSEGSLFHISEEGSDLVWKRTLPHRFRPRFILVSDKGQVLLLNEWVSDIGPYAIMILNVENELIFQINIDEVIEILNVSRAEIGKKQKPYSWIKSSDSFKFVEEVVKIETSVGKVLVIQLKDGKIFIEK